MNPLSTKDIVVSFILGFAGGAAALIGKAIIC